MLVKTIILAAGITAVAAQTTNLVFGCVTNYDPNVDYFPSKITLADTTSHLHFSYSKSYKQIQNTITNETIVLYLCGTPKPVSATATRILQVPVKSVSIADTSAVTMLELLGKRQAIKYTTGGATYITSPCVQSTVNTPQGINDVDADPAKALAQLNSTDVTFAFPGDTSSMANNSVIFEATLDTGVIKRSEWLSFVAAFFNLEDQANTITGKIVDNFNCLATAANAQSSKPTVAFVQYDAPSSFNNNTASWKVKDAAYESDIVTAAGGKILVPSTGKKVSSISGDTYVFSSDADLLSVISSADILIDDTFGDVDSTSVYKSFGLTDSSAYNFVKNKQIYQTNKGLNTAGGENFYEDGVIFEHILLADFVSFVQPSLLPTSYNTTYLRNVFTTKQVTITGASCKDPAAALDLPTVTCPSAVAATTTTAAKGSGADRTLTSLAAAAVAVVAALFITA